MICALPKLKILDSVEIERSERIVALQNYQANRERFVKEREERLKNEKEKPVALSIAPAAEGPSESGLKDSPEE